MRFAVIDLGTNTCNLLIAETNSSGYNILHQSKQLVKLGDNRIKNNEISEAATQRALQSLLNHKTIIDNLMLTSYRFWQLQLFAMHQINLNFWNT